MTINRNKRISLFYFFLMDCGVLFLLLPLVVFADSDSKCVACHTSARSLLKVTRTIEAERGDVPTESAESVGEG